jgi:transposase
MVLKKQAVNLYLEGLGFRSIERILKVSHVSVLNWVKKFGKEIEAIREPEREIEIIEMDELHTYIQHKKTTVGYGLLLIGLGEDSLISCLVVEGRKPEKNFLTK